MKLVPIFVSQDTEDGLWSIHLDGESQNEFEKFFDLMNDIEWLHNFFEQNKVDMLSGFFESITIGVAVSRTLDEIEEMENALYDYSEQGFGGSDNKIIIKMNNLKEKLSNLASDQPSDWKDKAKYRHENREWLKKSAAIAVRVLDALKAQDLSQKELAQRMNISPQQISKIVKGQENLTLETISNLEIALGIQIIDEKANPNKNLFKKKKPAA